MDDASLIARFEDCTLTVAELGHREHVRIAWLYLRQDRFEEAARRFCSNLRRYAEAKGKGGLFHATITWAYLAIVNERLYRLPTDDFATFVEANADLFDRKAGALSAYYDKPMLDSALARSVFLLPSSRSPGLAQGFPEGVLCARPEKLG